MSYSMKIMGLVDIEGWRRKFVADGHILYKVKGDEKPIQVGCTNLGVS